MLAETGLVSFLFFSAVSVTKRAPRARATDAAEKRGGTCPESVSAKTRGRGWRNLHPGFIASDNNKYKGSTSMCRSPRGLLCLLPFFPPTRPPVFPFAFRLFPTL
jgi:hypothetical protein